ncbi:hypothetical protein AK812_SmicGene26917 [Symbiodinium microadriaticum]|uniref:Uncharacterized protein n=1 Tax=Symbiodinium microadriaticum TaxID=2951 RepID=A0A1Q9D8C7_SYMMI|nr:hypothetical protein AK812_SmicGene26917 [Symbiodinium microadriaticum]
MQTTAPLLKTKAETSGIWTSTLLKSLAGWKHVPSQIEAQFKKPWRHVKDESSLKIRSRPIDSGLIVCVSVLQLAASVPEASIFARSLRGGAKISEIIRDPVTAGKLPREDKALLHGLSRLSQQPVPTANFGRGLSRDHIYLGLGANMLVLFGSIVSREDRQAFGSSNPGAKTLLEWEQLPRQAPPPPPGPDGRRALPGEES